MARKLIMTLIALAMMPAVALPLEIAGKTLPDEFKAGQENLILNGGGLRTKWFMNIYAAGLYVKSKSGDAQQLIDADEPMAIKIIAISDMMTRDKLVAALLKGYKNYTGGNLAPLQERIDRFIQAHTGVIKPDDVYEYVYIPGKGINIYKNGSYKITLEGLDYKKATFGIWLGKKPALESLKQGMLGK